MRVFDVWAEWCPPCKRFSPVFEKVAEEFDSVVFAKIEADHNAEFLNHYKINSIPTILITNDSGEVLFQHAGVMTEGVFRNLVETYMRATEK